MRGRKLLLLVAILVCGALIEAAHDVRDQLSIGPTGCRVISGRFYGPSFTFDSEASHAIQPGGALLVENAFGAVVVRGGAAAEVSARLRTRVYASERETAREFADRVQLRFDEADGRIRLSTNRDELGSDERRTPGFETELELQVPAETAVEIRSHHSRVELIDVASGVVTASYEPVVATRIAGALEIDARQGHVQVETVGGSLRLKSTHGEVSVADVAGPARLEVRHGGVRARRIGGLRLLHRYGDLDAAEVTGDLEIDGAHSGVKAEGISGQAHVETSYADVRLSGVGGDVRAVERHAGLRVDAAAGALRAEVSDGRVRLEAITGPLELTARRSDVRVSGLREGGRLETDGNDVEVRDFSGSLEVKARLGDVHLVAGTPLASPLVASTRDGGSVTVELDPGAGLRLAAEAPHGEVRSELSDFEASRRERGRLEGRVGKADTPVSLRAERGDVTVLERRDR